MVNMPSRGVLWKRSECRGLFRRRNTKTPSPSNRGIIPCQTDILLQNLKSNKGSQSKCKGITTEPSRRTRQTKIRIVYLSFSQLGFKINVLSYNKSKIIQINTQIPYFYILLLIKIDILLTVISQYSHLLLISLFIIIILLLLKCLLQFS